jgi:hypothetical protein
MVPFDPVGLKSETMELKEVKNGRLAMISLVGYASQAAVTVCCYPFCRFMLVSALCLSL